MYVSSDTQQWGRLFVDAWLREHKVNPATIKVTFVDFTQTYERVTVSEPVTYNQAKDGVRGSGVVYEGSTRLKMEWSIGRKRYRGILVADTYLKPELSVERLPSVDWEADAIAAADEVAQEQKTQAEAAQRTKALAVVRARQQVATTINIWLRNVGIDPSDISFRVPDIIDPSNTDDGPSSIGLTEVLLRFKDHQFKVLANVSPLRVLLAASMRIAPEFPDERWRPAQTMPQIGKALQEERRLRGGA